MLRQRLRARDFTSAHLLGRYIPQSRVCGGNGGKGKRKVLALANPGATSRWSATLEYGYCRTWAAKNGAVGFRGRGRTGETPETAFLWERASPRRLRDACVTSNSKMC